MESLYYIYPKGKNVSFTLISEEHIARLGNYIKVQDLSEGLLDKMMWTGKKKALVHPVGYIFLGDKITMFQDRIKRFEKLKKTSKLLGGFDTADSDRISQIFVKLLNGIDLVIVPSSWAKEVYKNSGVDIAVEVLPHGLPSEIFKSKSGVYNPVVKELKSLKKKNNAKLVLFFLTHSGFRKGADLVAKAMREIQSEFDNIYLVVKTAEVKDPYLSHFMDLKWIRIKGWMDWQSLAELYRVCDVVVSPSRGGGFELNALEAVAIGKPTLATNAMCFKDYIDYVIPIKVDRTIKVLPGNPIHIGDGYEISVDNLVLKLKEVLSNYSKYSRKFKRLSSRIREEFSWDNVCSRLVQILQNHSFIEGVKQLDYY